MLFVFNNHDNFSFDFTLIKTYFKIYLSLHLNIPIISDQKTRNKALASYDRNLYLRSMEIIASKDIPVTVYIESNESIENKISFNMATYIKN